MFGQLGVFFLSHFPLKLCHLLCFFCLCVVSLVVMCLRKFFTQQLGNLRLVSSSYEQWLFSWLLCQIRSNSTQLCNQVVDRYPSTCMFTCLVSAHPIVFWYPIWHRECLDGYAHTQDNRGRENCLNTSSDRKCPVMILIGVVSCFVFVSQNLVF